MSRSKTAHPTKFVQLVIVRDPDSGLEVELEIRKDTVTGAMIGLDGSFLDQDVGRVCDPYNPGEELEIPDDEAPLDLATRADPKESTAA
jgi:hypothetical protein